MTDIHAFVGARQSQSWLARSRFQAPTFDCLVKAAAEKGWGRSQWDTVGGICVRLIATIACKRERLVHHYWNQACVSFQHLDTITSGNFPVAHRPIQSTADQVLLIAVVNDRRDWFSVPFQGLQTFSSWDIPTFNRLGTTLLKWQFWQVNSV